MDPATLAATFYPALRDVVLVLLCGMLITLAVCFPTWRRNG